MEIGEMLRPESPKEWRVWLAEHHQAKAEIWLVMYKLRSGKKNLSLLEAQEHALCFGWVDSTLKPVDDECYALRFTPRRRNSNWGSSNKALALRMLREGRMSTAGKGVLPPEVLTTWEKESRAKLRKRKDPQGTLP
ncbi:MAG: hypothetical protein ABSG38_17490 [Spirochaetia bacterium]|jgi:uncharacterized protein YdeI (YjbR/CyaY-like superfamily)